MLLSKVKEYIKLKKSQSLLEISRHFDITLDVLEDMLNFLVKKGKVRLCKKTPICGTKCNKCSLAETEIYEWVEES